MQKKELRKLIRQRKAEHTAEEKAEMSARICRQVLANPHWTEAKTVFLYHALPDEVDTAMLIDAAMKEGKTVLLPVIDGDDLQLKIHTGTTQTGSYSIQEPIGEEFTCYKEIALAIVPGMAFDKKGNRLGRGRGFYDRTLPKLAEAYKIGLCFPFQFLESIPCETYDIKMDAVLCDS
jgi:5-formyltetrahydrofolate cyclo-ligase